MSIFGTLLSKIFPSNHPAITAQQGQDASGATSTSATPTSLGTSTPSPTASPPSSTANVPPVDVAAVLSGMAEKNSQSLNWRTSIVDLMKLVEMDSSLAARKALAQELHYSGDPNDSATMNVWLQGQVMKKIAENGGKLPDDLKS